MCGSLEKAIAGYTRSRTDELFLAIYQAFLTESLLVPVVQPVKEIQAGHYDVPVVCFVNEDGLGAIPAFTSTEHLLVWKPQGCLYATLLGRALIKMAVGMREISEIQINPNGMPHGRIPRMDFLDMLEL